MSFWGKRLQEVRLTHSMTQSELAKKLDIDTTALSRYESGRGSKQMSSKLKDKMLSVFTLDEINYIDIGTTTSQAIHGNNNNQAGGNQSIQTKEEIDDAIINAVVRMLKDFDEEKKLTALHYITEIRRGKIV